MGIKNTTNRYYFPGEPVYKEITLSCSTNPGRYESRNYVVSLKTDTSKSKQYLFSISSYDSIVELIDIDSIGASDSGTSYCWTTSTFLDTQRIFSIEFSVIEIGDTNSYVIAYNGHGGYTDGKEWTNSIGVRKFQFDQFTSTLSSARSISGPYLAFGYNGRSISVFRLDERGLIVVFYCVYDGNSLRTRYYQESDMTYLSESAIENDGVNINWIGNGIFYKGIAVKGDFCAFFYYHGRYNNNPHFKLRKYNGNYDYDTKYNYRFDASTYSFKTSMEFNAFYKLKDDLLIAMTNSGSTLYLFLFDFYNDYSGLKIREYRFGYSGKIFGKELAARMYNEYIVFTGTLGDTYWDTINNCFSLMMIFGFGNGTDHTIDISPYLADTGYYDDNYNLYQYLYNNMSVDNNIFDYEKVPRIRLINISDELLLYRGKLNVDMEENTLPVNEFFTDNITLLQNRNLTKIEDKLYTLGYQYQVKTPEYTKLYESAKTVKNFPDNYDGSSYYQSKILEGRVNYIKFKLCHRYCIKCIEYGPSDNDQRCVNCKDPYTYDYLNYVNRFTGNCVEEGYMYDVEDQELKVCSGVYKYYFNITSGQKICFKYDYECPIGYRYLNTTTNECIDWALPTTIITTIPTTIITTIPTTIITTIPTTIITTIPTTIITTIPTTIITTIPTTILTTIPTTILTTIPTTTITTIPTTIFITIPTTILTTIPTTTIATIFLL